MPAPAKKSLFSRVFARRPARSSQPRLEGERRTFVADRISVSESPKMVNYPQGRMFARGKTAMAYTLEVFKGKHKAPLVIKKYNNSSMQSEHAESEFYAFKRLRSKGFPVPPTARLVESKGVKYVALTDLSRFGDIQTKHLTDVGDILGEKEFLRLNKMTLEMTMRARRDAGIELADSWEYVIDTKKRTVRAFILDLGAQNYFSSHGLRL